MTARVLGLDPSLESTGCAEFTTDGHTTDHRTWTITSTGRAHASWAQRANRLDRIVRNLGASLHNDVGDLRPIDLALIEGHVTGAPGDPHDRSGLWWLVYRELTSWGVPVAVVAPTTRIKYATGKGRGTKLAVVSAMARRWPLTMIDTDDEWDALAIGEIGAHRLGFPMPHTLTKPQRETLGAVTWPDGLRAIGAVR